MRSSRHQSSTRVKAVSYRGQDARSESSQETFSDDDYSLSDSPVDTSPITSELNMKSTKGQAKDNPEAARVPGTKKRPLLRKEIQRRYRERQKLKRELESGSATQIDGEMALLVAENSKLQETRLALLASLHQANIITEFLESCRLSNTAAFPFSPNNPIEVADALFNNALFGYEPSEYLIRTYADLPPSLLIERDKNNFPMVLDTLMAEWYSTYSTRDEVTVKLQHVFNTRRRISMVIAEKNPKKHKELMANTMQPGPGSALGDLAAQSLRRVSQEINLTGQQVESIRKAWCEYAYAIESLNFDVQMARVTIDSLQNSNQQEQPLTTAAAAAASRENNNNASGSNTVAVASPSSNTVTSSSGGSHQQQSKEFLTLSDSVATLSQSSRRMSVAYTRLAAAVLSTFDVIQLAKLFRGCRPFFPNQVALCKLIVDGE